MSVLGQKQTKSRRVEVVRFVPLADMVMRLFLLLPTALNDQTDLAASVLHDIEARVSVRYGEVAEIGDRSKDET